MSVWLERETIAEDVKAWTLEERDRQVARAESPQVQALLTIAFNVLVDFLDTKMFLAESQAKDAYEAKHCEPGKCCNDEEPL